MSKKNQLPKWLDDELRALATIDSSFCGPLYQDMKTGALLVLERLEKTREADPERKMNQYSQGYDEGRESVRREVLGE